MACNWITNSQGDIVGAKINGTEERSKLFDDLNEEFGMDKAMELFAVSESTSFKDIFGGNKSKLDVTVFSEVLDKAVNARTYEDFVEDMSDFRDVHSAPSKSTTLTEDKLDQGGDFSLLEVAQGFHNQPDDYFDPNVGARYYMYNNKQGMESFTAINNVIRGIKAGKKGINITAYRAVPKNLDVTTLKDYDWVSFSESYAISHGESRFGSKGYKLIEQEVSLQDLWWDGNDINEFGYDTGGTKKYSKKELRKIWDNRGTIKIEEPSKQNVIKYAIEENKTEEKLTKEQLVDLQDFSNFNTQKLQDAFYDKNGFFIVSESKLVKSGLYNEYEASSIARDTQLQNKIKDSLERLKNTPQEELNIEEVEVDRSVIGEFNSFGKLVALNPFLAEKEMTEDQKQADTFIEVDSVIRQKNTTETEITLQQTAKQTENNKVSTLLNLSIETLQNNEGATREVLNEIEDDLIEDSIDVIGLKDQPIDESLIDYLNTLNTFIEKPSTENTKLFAEKSDEYFKRDLTPKKETVVGEDGKEYVKLNTELSEEEVYNQQGLIKVDDNTYLKTAKEDLATLYENVRTYKEKYPKDKTLEEYVQEQIANYSFKDAEVAEAVVLYKMYFGVGNRDREGNLLAPNGKKSNLNEEQYKLVRTPEFKAWFGDWQNDPQNASKVVDENGEPRVLYHSTNEDFTEFDTARIGKNYTPHYGAGFYFADSYRGAMEYGGKLGFYFINIKNLKTYSYGFKYESQEKGFQDVADYSKNLGIDGLVYGEEYKQYIVFNPNQIKSATEIKGTTNEETNDIRFLKKIKPTNQTSNFTGDYQYLTEEFPSDFYSKFLAEKKKNSKLFRTFYSNFEINEKGINIVNTDPISMRNIRIYADENLRQYSILSKQMPNISDDLSNDESISERDNVVNNPQTLKKFQGKIHKLNNNEVIVKNNTEQFIKIGDTIYEAIEVLGNLTHFVKLENEVTQYHKVGIGQPTSSLKLADYNYLNDSVNAEDFKDVRKGENPEELDC